MVLVNCVGREVGRVEVIAPAARNAEREVVEVLVELVAPAEVESCIARSQVLDGNSALIPRITLNELLKKKVQEKVQAIASEVPIYVAVVIKCCVGGNLFSLAFCKGYASAYLRSRDQTLTLQLKDKEWDTTLHVRPNSKAIHGGWSEFAIDNDLRLGYICLFAKRGIRILVMRIHIVRNSGDQTCRKETCYKLYFHVLFQLSLGF
ncbi:B3 domain-containing protein LOC_Os12g40080-like [Lolium rigidum]|uniref:B3 domain-containing protein LOC_Os12g40080-like n=1 Tax=Lolium rigidum TaxID=89674 RepID=UPI001F5CF16F|nr:B3 domain-containing protein LOC_Os12g40080-like [Lolium rigidum]